ncbi:chymotrypsinogen A-like [Megalobrama amblycephala]|uniref:chymotrypsinogen A-like n=1 Tax=Megalobrama amblycephala TaxID=75352 RepID=UPI002014657B|nr:chymotrypsinogen A-like [Megalobrama amblycephala]
MWRTCVTLALLICVQVCAHVPLYPRIMGGADAQKKAWPWIVSLHDPTCHFCGGSLINSQWVLSAAHCFIGDDYNVTEDRILVYLGKLTQREKNKKEKMIKVQKIYTHNMYNATTNNNDIALLHLSDKVKFNDHISPVCLIAHGSDFPTGTRSRIIGWGLIEDGMNVPYPGILQEAEVFVVDHNHKTENTISSCLQGDSGGPMMSQHCSKWVQFGITSWGIGCGLQHIPGVYTRVSQYQQWITDKIRGHQSDDLPQFVNISHPCPSSTARSSTSKWCCCF